MEELREENAKLRAEISRLKVSNRTSVKIPTQQHSDPNEELRNALVGRNAIPTPLNWTKPSVAMRWGNIYHETPEKVKAFFLSDTTTGVFRRTTLSGVGELSRVVFWTHSFNRKDTVEYLLKLEIKGHVVTLESITADQLPTNEALEILDALEGSLEKGQRVTRAIVGEGRIDITAHPYGQSSVALTATLEAGSTHIKTTSATKVEDSASFRRHSTHRRSSHVESVLGFQRGDTFDFLQAQSASKLKTMAKKSKGSDFILQSMEAILAHSEMKFHQPNVIDERKINDVALNLLVDPPPLTDEEATMMIKVKGVEEEFHKFGKRVSGTVRDKVKKFLWKDKDLILYGGCIANIDVSAVKLLSYIIELDTYEKARLHVTQNGDLPRFIKKNVDGTRAYQYSVGIAVSSPYKPRYFESWTSWKAGVQSNGLKEYTIGMLPLSAYSGSKEKVEGFSYCVKGESTGLFIVSEKASNVCTLTRIQSVNLNAKLPGYVIETLTKNELMWGNKLQALFKRNENVVDEEVRNFTAARMREGVELTDEQREIFGKLDKLFDRDGWQGVKSLYPRVQIWVNKNFGQQESDAKNLRMISARGETMADCSADEAAAWYFDYCSNRRLEKDRIGAKGDIRIRIPQEGERINDALYAKIMSFPYPLSKREVVFRQIWKRNEDGGVSVCVHNTDIDKKIDYGGEAQSAVRAISHAIFTATNVESITGVPQCKIILSQYFDALGTIPISVMNSKAPRIMQVVDELKKTFSRDDKIDCAALTSTANVIKNVPQIFSEEEEEAIKRGKAFYTIYNDSEKYKELKMDDSKVNLRAVHLDGESLVAGVATTTVDASVEECASYEFCSLYSRKFKRSARDRGITDMTVKRINDHSLYYLTTRDIGVPGFAEREFRTKVTWQKDEHGRVMLDFSDTTDCDGIHPVKPQSIVAEQHTVWYFETLPPKGDVPQTKVVFATKVDLSGAMPSRVMNSLAPRFTSVVSDIRRKFDRSIDIDTANRLQIVERMRNLEVNSSKTFDEIFEAKPGIRVSGGDNTLSNTSLKTFDSKFSDVMGMVDHHGGFSSTSKTWIKILGAGRGLGKTVVAVRAGLEEVAAYFWDFESRENALVNGGLVGVIEEKLRDFQIIVKRDGSFLVKLHRVDQDTVVITMEPSDEGSANQDVAVRFTRVGHETSIEYVTEMSLGAVGGKTVKSRLLRELGRVPKCAFYFISKVKSADLSAADGQGVADALARFLKENKGRQKEDVMATFITETASLEELSMKYEFVKPMLCAVVANRLTGVAKIQGKAECLTEAQGSAIGRSLAISLATTLTASAGVDEWIHQFPALQEIDKGHDWFRPMLVAIGMKLVGEVGWGVKMRVSIGASLSMFDLGTDIFVCYMFYVEQKTAYFHAVLGTIVLSVALQLLVILAQNIKLGWKRFSAEALPVIVGVKPAVDAYRVATGKKEEVGQMFDSMVEMTATKLIELFAEAVPGVFIQMYSILAAGEASTAALTSIAASTLSAGFIAASVSYDYDTDPNKRHHTPEYFGFVPANARLRTVVFLSMIVMSGSLLLLRCAAMAMIGMAGQGWVGVFIGTDICIFFLAKLARRDFWYFLPLGGNLEVVSSVGVQSFLKVVLDFSGIMSLRIPTQLGGFNWALSVLVTLASLPFAIRFYETEVGNTNVLQVAYLVSQILIPTALVTLLTFFLCINKNYIWTFFSIQRSKDLTMTKIKASEEDSVKALYAFKRSRNQWKPLEDEVRTWVRSNWETWTKTNPKWFTEAIRVNIPLEFVPLGEDREIEARWRRERVAPKKKTMARLAGSRSKVQVNPADESSGGYDSSWGEGKIRRAQLNSINEQREDESEEQSEEQSGA